MYTHIGRPLLRKMRIQKWGSTYAHKQSGCIPCTGAGCARPIEDMLRHLTAIVWTTAHRVFWELRLYQNEELAETDLAC